MHNLKRDTERLFYSSLITMLVAVIVSFVLCGILKRITGYAFTLTFAVGVILLLRVKRFERKLKKPGN